MLRTNAVILLVFYVLTEGNARDALMFFVEHRVVQNYSFAVLSSVNATDTIWVEYQYYFKGFKKEESRFSRNSGVVLNVGVFENTNTPFDCKFDRSGSGGGYSSRVLTLLQEKLFFGVNFININYTLLIQNITESVITNKLDLLLCHPKVNYFEDSSLTQLHPTLQSDYILIYKSSKLHMTNDIFILTFAGTLWLCFLLLLIILAICLHISTRRYATIYPNYQAWTWVDITLWANAAACQQGLSHTPDGFSSRCIFFLGYLTSYLLYTGFAAGITSLLLQQGIMNKITVTDLAKMNLKAVTVSDAPFPGNYHGFSNDSIVVSNMDDFFNYLERENAVGIAPTLYVEQHFANEFDFDMTDLYSTSVIPNTHYKRGFVVLRNSTYKKILNNGLISLKEFGLLNNVLKRSLLPVPSQTASSNYSSAGLEHVGSAILILLVGTVSSTVFLVAELIIALYTGKC